MSNRDEEILNEYQIEDLLAGRFAVDDAPRLVEALARQLWTPEVDDFTAGVVAEAQHQRVRWGSEHDAGKEPQDWYWLLAYLSGKALRAAIDGDQEKALHHCISSAAVLANWHAFISGQHSHFRPGTGLGALTDIAPEPLPMILHCPDCGEQHIDAPDDESGWSNPPHKSHLCHACGTIWRPADVPTEGVSDIETRGKRDTWPRDVEPTFSASAPVRFRGTAPIGEGKG